MWQRCNWEKLADNNRTWILGEFWRNCITYIQSSQCIRCELAIVSMKLVHIDCLGRVNTNCKNTSAFKFAQRNLLCFQNLHHKLGMHCWWLFLMELFHSRYTRWSQSSKMNIRLCLEGCRLNPPVSKGEAEAIYCLPASCYCSVCLQFDLWLSLWSDSPRCICHLFVESN